MAYYRCEGGGSSVELPDLYEGCFYNRTEFQTDDYVVIINANKSLAIPVGSQNDFICISVSSAGLVTATPLLNSDTIKPIQPAAITIQAATAAIATYGFSIIKLLYIDANTILLLYNWQTDANKLSATYMRTLAYRGGIVYQSNVDTIFAASLVSPGNGIAGSAFVGQIFKADSPYGDAYKLGIIYGNRQYSASGLTKTNVYHGFIATYTTTSASYVQIAKTVASTQSISGGTESFNHTKSSYYWNQALGSGYFLRESGTNVGGIQQFVTCISRPEGRICLGKLSDGKVLFLDEYNSKIYIYSEHICSTWSDTYTDAELDLPVNYRYPAYLLKGNMIIYRDANTYDVHLVQIVYKNNSYEILDLGTINYTEIGTGEKRTINGADILGIPRPGGFLSDSYYMIGNRMDPNYGTLNISPLSVDRYELAATTIGKYALFGGGMINSSTYSNVVDAYNSSLTRSIPTALSTSRSSLAAASNSNYALFGGGVINESSSGHSNVVDAYNSSLTRSIPTALSTSRSSLAAASNSKYALFGGGMIVGGTYSNVVDAYNSSLTRSIPTALSTSRPRLVAASNSNYALFGGGGEKIGTGTYSNTVDAYNSSLTRSIPTALSKARSSLAAASIGNYVLFAGGCLSSAGGYVAPDAVNTVDAYNSLLTRSTPTTLSAARYNLKGVSVGNYALFGGGQGGENIVDAYDSSLVRSIPMTFSKISGGYYLYYAAASIGNYALFGGKSAEAYKA